MAKATQEEKDEIVQRLRERLPEGTALYGMVVHVARSGMSRSIKLLYVDDKRNIQQVPSGWLAQLLDERFDVNRYAVNVSGCGCGMNMVLDTVMRLSRKLYGATDSLEYRYL